MTAGDVAARPLTPETPLAKLTARLADIKKQADHGEMWGVELSSDASHAPTQVVLQKFLRANNGDLAGAEKQLGAALAWRKKFRPTALVTQAFDKKKFDGLGFVTKHRDDAGKTTVITWNIYGSVKDNKATFGDITEFLKWRTALMELGVQQLRLNDIKEPLLEDGTDGHQMLQVHDYRSVSFFRMDPAVKAASKETISVFSTAYPELLAHKYFVNVPAIMGWMFGAMKLFLAPATLKKFHPMASGASLSNELKSIAPSLPREYGGGGSPVHEGLVIALVGADAEAAKEEAPAEPKPDPKLKLMPQLKLKSKPKPKPKSEQEPEPEVATEETTGGAAAAEPQTADIAAKLNKEEEEKEEEEEEEEEGEEGEEGEEEEEEEAVLVEAKKEDASAAAPVELEVEAEEEKGPAEKAKNEADESKADESKADEKEVEEAPVAAAGAPEEAGAAPKEAEKTA